MTGCEASIMGRATQAAETMRRGGGIGYDFSTLRPRGTPIRKLESTATGPVSFMSIFDAVGLSISSSGHRRGAQMGVLRCLAGDTRVHTLEGRVPISQLVGERPYLYVVRNGRVAVERANRVFKSGSKRVVTVVLDNDTEITCTPDHKFMLSNGVFVEARHLNPCDSLMALTKSINNRGYYMIGCTGTRANPEHRIVYECLVGPIRKNHHVHHRNENKQDNRPDNLVSLTKSQHAKLHLEILEQHRMRIAQERKGKTLEQWLGTERGTQIRAKMRAAKKVQADQLGAWNHGLAGEAYKAHYRNGFRNQHNAILSNHRVVRVEDRGEICEVYDVSMPHTHNFFVEEVCVHNCDHPDIEEFIRAKQEKGKLTGFNISVAVTDEFMKAVESDSRFPLVFEKRVYSEVRARDLWESMMRATWDWAEPGVLFIDRINQSNNLHYCETIAATNPCGEQPLPPFGACLLGSFNLTRYLIGPVGRARFDHDQLALDIPHIVRAMDNVVDRSRYPLQEQEQEALAKRRMGLGVTGLASALHAMGHEYGSAGFLETFEEIMTTIRDHVYMASAQLAAEKGPFLKFERVAYLDSVFAGTLPPKVRDAIARCGIRNSHLLSIAPTGTISMCADNISSGIEPVFAHRQRRMVSLGSDPVEIDLLDYGYGRGWGEAKLAADCTVKDHLSVLAVAARYVDSAVSKTCNVPSGMPWEAFKDIYMQAWKMGAKGCTTFQDGGMREGIIHDAAAEACRIDPVTGRRECA
jgi:ribonucleoside-diphosphate reductase alpha chain